jgi:hypothetical protein
VLLIGGLVIKPHSPVAAHSWSMTINELPLVMVRRFARAGGLRRRSGAACPAASQPTSPLLSTLHPAGEGR